jgi:hypothetical protein
MDRRHLACRSRSARRWSRSSLLPHRVQQRENSSDLMLSAEWSAQRYYCRPRSGRRSGRCREGQSFAERRFTGYAGKVMREPIFCLNRRNYTAAKALCRHRLEWLTPSTPRRVFRPNEPRHVNDRSRFEISVKRGSMGMTATQISFSPNERIARSYHRLLQRNHRTIEMTIEARHPWSSSQAKENYHEYSNSGRR